MRIVFLFARIVTEKKVIFSLNHFLYNCYNVRLVTRLPDISLTVDHTAITFTGWTMYVIHPGIFYRKIIMADFPNI